MHSNTTADSSQAHARILDHLHAAYELAPADGFSRRFLAHCPCSQHHANGDEHPSLCVSVNDGSGDYPSGSVVLHCNSGVCTQDEILEALNLDYRARYARAPRRGHGWSRFDRKRERNPFRRAHLRRVLLDRDADLSALLRSGVTLDALASLDVGFEQDSRLGPRVVLPMRDLAGAVVGKLLRAPWWLDGGHPIPKRMRGQHGLFRPANDYATHGGPIVIVEGGTDALYARSLRFDVIGVPSANWPTKPYPVSEVRRFLRRYRYREIWIVGHGDEAGRAFAERMGALARLGNQTVRVGVLDDDVRSLVQEIGPAEARTRLLSLFAALPGLAASKPGPKAEAREEVKARVLDLLDGGIALTRTTLAERTGASEATLRRATQELPVVRQRLGQRGHFWILEAYAGKQ